MSSWYFMFLKCFDRQYSLLYYGLNRVIRGLNFSQLRTFRGHTNEKNFVGLTVNSEYLACGSETNEVVAYHKVRERFKWSGTLAFWHRNCIVKFFRYFCRRSQNQQLHIDLFPMGMMLMMKPGHISSVLCAGRVIAQQCWLQTVKELLKCLHSQPKW